MASNYVAQVFNLRMGNGRLITSPAQLFTLEYLIVHDFNHSCFEQGSLCYFKVDYGLLIIKLGAFVVEFGDGQVCLKVEDFLRGGSAIFEAIFFTGQFFLLQGSGCLRGLNALLSRHHLASGETNFSQDLLFKPLQSQQCLGLFILSAPVSAASGTKSPGKLERNAKIPFIEICRYKRINRVAIASGQAVQCKGGFQIQFWVTGVSSHHKCEITVLKIETGSLIFRAVLECI